MTFQKFYFQLSVRFVTGHENKNVNFTRIKNDFVSFLGR